MHYKQGKCKVKENNLEFRSKTKIPTFNPLFNNITVFQFRIINSNSSLAIMMTNRLSLIISQTTTQHNKVKTIDTTKTTRKHRKCIMTINSSTKEVQLQFQQLPLNFIIHTTCLQPLLITLKIMLSSI